MSVFKIVEKRRTWWPVTFRLAAEDGSVVSHQIKVRFWLPDEDELVEVQQQAVKISADLAPQLLAAPIAGPADDDAAQKRPSQLYAGIVGLVAEDWADVADDDGTDEGRPLDWSMDNLARFLRLPGTFSATMAAFREAHGNHEEIRAGN